MDIELLKELEELRQYGFDIDYVMLTNILRGE